MLVKLFLVLYYQQLSVRRIFPILANKCFDHGIAVTSNLNKLLTNMVCYLQVNQKMILTLTASIMYWSLQHVEESESSPTPSSRAASPDPSIDQSPTPVTTPISDTEVSSPAPFQSVPSNGSASPTSTITPAALPINGDSCPMPVPMNGSSSPAAADSHEASPATSASVEEDNSYVIPEVDDTTSESTISVPVEDVASDTATTAPIPEKEETHVFSE